MSEIIQENSIYTTKAEYDAIIADQSKAMDVLVFNFFAMLGLMNAVTHPGDVARIKRFFRSDKKLQLSNISDDNNDISLAIKIASEAGLFRTDLTAKEITRFLVKLKKGDIDEIDSRIVGKWAKALKPLALQSVSNPRMKKAFKDFADDGGETIDVSRLAVLGKRIAKQSEYSGDFRIYSKKYGKLQEITPKHIAADGSSDTTAQNPVDTTSSSDPLPSVKDMVAQKKAVKSDAEKAAEKRAKEIASFKSFVRASTSRDLADFLGGDIIQLEAGRNLKYSSNIMVNGPVSKRFIETYPKDVDLNIPWDDKEKIETFNLIKGSEALGPSDVIRVNNRARNVLRHIYVLNNEFKGDYFKNISVTIGNIIFELVLKYSKTNKIPGYEFARLKAEAYDVLYSHIFARFVEMGYTDPPGMKTLITEILLENYPINNSSLISRIMYNPSDFARRMTDIFKYGDRFRPISAIIADKIKDNKYDEFFEFIRGPFVLSNTPISDIQEGMLGAGYNSGPIKKIAEHYLDSCIKAKKILGVKEYTRPYTGWDDFMETFIEVLEENYVDYDKLKAYIDAGAVAVDKDSAGKFIFSIQRTGDISKFPYRSWLTDAVVEKIGKITTDEQRKGLAPYLYSAGVLMPISDGMKKVFDKQLKEIDALMKATDVQGLNHYFGRSPTQSDPTTGMIMADINKRYSDGELDKDEYVEKLADTLIASGVYIFGDTNATRLMNIMNGYDIRTKIDEEVVSAVALNILKRTNDVKDLRFSYIREKINHKTSSEEIQEFIKLIRESGNRFIFSAINYTEARSTYEGKKRDKQLEYISFLSECFFSSIGTEHEDYMSDLIDSMPPVVQNNIRGNIVGVSAVAAEMEDSPIKTFKNLSEIEIKNILRMNDVAFGSVSSGAMPRRNRGEKISDYIKRAKKMKGNGAPLLDAQKVTQDLDADVAKETSRVIDNYYAAKHGDIYPKFLKAFNVNFPSDPYDAFLSAMGGKGDGEIIPAFHGTGGVAASMILRYGFRIIKASDSSVVGRMLGNGIYFSNKVDKASQYISNGGYGRRWGEKGYLFEMKAALGHKGTNYRSAGVDGRDGIRSPEWCVFSTDQLKIEKVYEVVLSKYSEYKSVLKESERLSFKQILSEAKLRGNSPIEFRFRDGLIPILVKGKLEMVDFEDAIKGKLIKKELIEFSNQGPVLVFPGFRAPEFYDYRYGSDISGDKLAFLLKLLRAHK